eukprot:TRINITY_DN2953_c0_g1_i1.p1 TRINITY_DN2953_c0_g1~~TRINITY_DN2953_c0_g1_i1.p1  ORF type:complete len:1014 (-),score=354.22 TRINITY_DN2953_c0_g1_i1:466-3507(-)
MAPKRAKAEPKAKAPARGKAKAEPKAAAKAEAKAKAKAGDRVEEPPTKEKRKRLPPKEPEPAEEEPEEEDYDAMTMAQLKAKCSELGISGSGSKAALVERLEELGAAAASAKASKGAAKAKAEPKRGAAKAKAAAPEPDEEDAPPAKKAKAAPSDPKSPARGKAKAAAKEEKGKKRSADGEEKNAAGEEEQQVEVKVSGPTTVFYDDSTFVCEYAKSNRSGCKKCAQKIMEGSLRIGKMVASEKHDGMYPLWYHDTCFYQTGVFPRSPELMKGFSSIKPEDQEALYKNMPAEAGSEGMSEEMKEQGKKLFEIMEVLEDLSENQVKEMLELNDYPIKYLGQARPKDLCADGILFGACAMCSVCTEYESKPGHILLIGEAYRCRGWISEFLRCDFKTQTPERVPWKLTDVAKKAKGGKLAKMKMKTGTRLFIKELKDDDDPDAAAPSQSDKKKPPFLSLTLVVLADSFDEKRKEEIENMIKANGGSVQDQVTSAAFCVVSTKETAEGEEENGQVAVAKKQSIPGVSADFITKSVDASELVEMTEELLLWGEARGRRKIEETKTSKFVEKMGVKMDTDVGELADKAHVLVDFAGRRVYSEMLNSTDMVTGGNSFYTLHLLESDEEPKEYWVFRKWGRIGVNQGGVKIEEHHSNKNKAIAAFGKQYSDKTGNTYGHKREEFKTIPGKFQRVDLEHKALAKKKDGASQDDTNTGDAAGSDDQPLGKLSKPQIEKGDSVLDKVEQMLNDGKPSGDAQFKNLSAQYYMLIPHDFGAKRPPVIDNPDLLGAEKALLQFYLRMGFEDMSYDEHLTPIGGVMDLPLAKTLAEAAAGICSPSEVTNCCKKGKTMHNKKAGKPTKEMTADLYGSILLYTGNAIYKQLNKALRDEDRGIVQKYFSYLRMLFEACDRLPQQDRTLWRGVGVDLYDQYKVGSEIIWWGVSSCTSNQKVAQGFMSGCGGGASFLTVEAKTGCEISEVSFYANESETILLPGTKLLVVSSERVGASKCNIKLKEVGRVIT